MFGGYIFIPSFTVQHDGCIILKFKIKINFDLLEAKLYEQIMNKHILTD
jgi:hypothetical protein